MNIGNTRWSEEDAERVRVLWEAGNTSSYIAAKFQRVSRNAIIGLVRRRDWHQRKPHTPDGATAPLKREPRRASLPATKAAPVAKPKPHNSLKAHNITRKINAPTGADVPIEKPSTVDSADLVAFGSPGCKWPMRGTGADMLCCGAERVDLNRPYCEAHMIVATQPTATGKPRNAKTYEKSMARYA